MPPIRSQKSRKSIEQEGRLLLAVRALQNKEISTIREAARWFDVPHSSLQDQFHGRKNRVNIRANNHKLTENEEDSLSKWIISMDKCGAAPQLAMVHEMANLLLAERGSTTVGVNWVSNYIKRWAELKS